MPVTRNQSAFSQGSRPSLGASQPAVSADSSEPSEEGASGEASRRDSPENCSICLGPFNNKSFTSSCAHSFCFVCLRQWSKVKAECPLCKQPFTSIFHSVRSNDSYEIFYLPPRNVQPPIDYNLYGLVGGDLRAMTVAAPPYLSLPSWDADLTLSNFSRFQFRHRRYLGHQHHHHPGQHPVHGEHQYSYTGVQVNPATHINGDTWPRGAEDFRREVYRRRMGPPAVVLGTENSTYRLSPAMVAASPHRMERIMPWLTRELRVLLHGHQSLRLAISIIQPLLTQFFIDSEEFLNHVTPLLGRRSQSFMQQFIAYANSALPMQVYDRRAMYERPDYSTTLPVYSSGSSSSDDDVVEITSISSASNNNTTNNTMTTTSGSNNREGRGLAMTSATRVPTTSVQSSSLLSGLLSNHGWDSPIPGPSWETLNVVDDDDEVQIQEDPVSVSSETDDPVYRPDARNADSDNDSKAGSDLVFLKYDKPWNERSPINLSSSSEAEEPVDHSKKRKKSKHKKKSKDTESKSYKPSIKIKIRRKHKARRSRDNEEDDYEVGSDSSEEEDRRRSQSIGSGDRASGKRHKKSRDRSKKSSRRNNERNSDRELVDRLFAEAITQPDLTSIFQEEPTSTFQTEVVENRQTSGKSKEKRKKKRRSSLSPSTSRAYKKHHSGHKKSTDPSRSSHAQRHSSRELAAASHTTQETVAAGTAGSSMSPTVPRPASFQPSFLPIPDTVQHIPLNLWVSTWPALSVSTHTFSSGPPPTSTALPHALNLSAPRSGGPGMPPPHTNSSSSSSDNASDDDRETRSNNSSNAPGSQKRTKKWVESNFLNNQASTEVEKNVSSSSSRQSANLTHTYSGDAVSAVKNSKKSRNFSTDFLLNVDKAKAYSSDPRPSSTSVAATNSIEVVCSSDDEQNESGGDDILVCSSENAAGSDSDSLDDKRRKNPRAEEMKSQRHDGDFTAQDASINPAGQDVSTICPEALSSRLKAFEQACSKMGRPTMLSYDSLVPAPNPQINPDDEALSHVPELDFMLDAEQPRANSTSASASFSGRLNKIPNESVHGSIQSESVATTTTAASSAPNIVTTTLASQVSAVVMPGSNTEAVVTTAPFYMFTGSSAQTLSQGLPSEQRVESSYLPYSTMTTAPISFPPSLLPPSVPLGIPKVPELPVPNAFSFHQSMASIIQPAAGVFPLYSQNDEASASLSPGNSARVTSSVPSEAANTQLPLVPNDTLKNEAFPTQIANGNTLPPCTSNTAMHTLPHSFPPLLAGPSSAPQNLATPVVVHTSTSLASAQQFSDAGLSQDPSVMQGNSSVYHGQSVATVAPPAFPLPCPAPRDQGQSSYVSVPVEQTVDPVSASSSSTQCDGTSATIGCKAFGFSGSELLSLFGEAPENHNIDRLSTSQTETEKAAASASISITDSQLHAEARQPFAESETGSAVLLSGHLPHVNMDIESLPVPVDTSTVDTEVIDSSTTSA
ncbi:E3 ubiquitin-protein ligase Topors-like [Elysia marginata]|uniref:E3 ubiquitin-protein ligase Topors n=1 Tax=Elysia marginata TaxID=1093978 RepID=A0AAV4GX80_9GAST|nr:E3 ubiquitin-protein ligase Topors-like [Elysia marginata]